jgi:hypothetical protein
MSILSLTDLETVTGGATAASTSSPFSQFKGNLTDSLRGKYKDLVCGGAGLEGGEEFATKVYGPNATSADRVRATQMITKFCNDGKNLPAAAPAFPFGGK